MSSEESSQLIFFSPKEVVEELIKKQGLYRGLWKLTLEVGLVGSNVNVLKDGKTVLTPTAMVLVSRIGIAPAIELDDLTVDAAEVNPVDRKSIMKKPKKSLKKR